MLVLREEIIGAAVQVGEIAAPSARDKDLSPWLPVVFEQRHAPASLTGYRCTHQPRRSRSQNNYVELARGCWHDYRSE
jgi:hypothetical protein